MIAGKTGRHTFTQWDQVLMHEGAHHPALNPYKLPENKGLRTTYPEGMCKGSLDILNRTVMVATNPQHSDAEIEDMIHNIDQAAAWRWRRCGRGRCACGRTSAGRSAEVRQRRTEAPPDRKDWRYRRSSRMNAARSARTARRIWRSSIAA